MEIKQIKHSTHILGNDYDGYLYRFNTTRGTDFNSHLHKCYEFIHVIHGQLIYTVEGNEYMLSDGDFIMTNPAELHSFSFPNESDYQREFLHIYPGFIDKFPELIKGLNSRKAGYFNRFSAEIVRKYGIDKIFREMEKCCAEVVEETDFLMLTYSMQLIAKIHQVLRCESPESQSIITNKNANAVCRYIDDHFAEDVSIESIARTLFVSPSYLSRMFKKETGMTIKSYLNIRRVTCAKNLITEDKNMIKNIYMECGYRDYSTFYRAFVKYAGLSPEEFKQTHSQMTANADNKEFLQL